MINGSFQPGIDIVPSDGRPDMQQILPQQREDVIFAAGLGRQRLYIVPSQNLVIVRFGMTLGDSFSDQALLSRIQDAFK